MVEPQRLAARLPEHYQADREDSILHNFLVCVAKELSAVETSISSLMRSRWLNTADGEDLERIGALFGLQRLVDEDEATFRTRLRRTISELLAGAGSVASISKLVAATIGIEPQVIENPKRLRESGEHFLRSGDGWLETSHSIQPDNPTIIVNALNTVLNPSLINLTAEESVTYHGILKKGDYLIIMPSGRAYLAGVDVSDRITTTTGLTPVVGKNESTWRYVDATAFFDYGRFDEHVFAEKAQYSVSVRLRWFEATPACCVIRIPLYTKKDDKMRTIDYQTHLRQEVRRLVEKVKPAGVQMLINYWDDFGEHMSQPCDILIPKLGQAEDEVHSMKAEFEISVSHGFTEKQPMSDIVLIGSAFNISRFDSGRFS